MRILGEGFSSADGHYFLISQKTSLKVISFLPMEAMAESVPLGNVGVCLLHRDRRRAVTPHSPSPRKHQYEDGIISKLHLCYTRLHLRNTTESREMLREI